MNARLEGFPPDPVWVRGLLAKMAAKKRPVPETKRIGFTIAAPKKVSIRTRKPNHDHGDLLWRAADDLFARLRDLRKVQRTGAIADKQLVGALEYWALNVTTPQLQKALAMDLAMTAWAFVTGRDDAKGTVERAMLHRQDGVELNSLQLDAVRNKPNLAPEVRAQLVYNIIAEGSAAALPPDTNTRRDGSLSKLIRSMNPYINGE